LAQLPVRQRDHHALVPRPRGTRPRHLTYPSYHALFYLHPARFTPDPQVRAELGVVPGARFGIVRLSALAAHHDAGVRGLSEEMVSRLRQGLPAEVRLFVTSEKPLTGELRRWQLPLRPSRIHHAVALADFVLGDSQTMTAEAAVLGVPAFRVSDFVGRISYLRELEDYGLAFGFRPGEEGRRWPRSWRSCGGRTAARPSPSGGAACSPRRSTPCPGCWARVRELVGPAPAHERSA
jgi:predicted glycosyltransferase